MSIDFQVVCLTCRKAHHLGQRMASYYSFGFGSLDQTGRAEVWAWLAKHVDPEDGEPHDVRIMLGSPEGVETESVKLDPAEVEAQVRSATGGRPTLQSENDRLRGLVLLAENKGHWAGEDACPWCGHPKNQHRPTCEAFISRGVLR